MTITIKFTIPVAEICAFLVGIVAGCALVWLALAGVDVWSPVLALPALAASRRVEASQDVEDHPAVAAFKAVPLPVRAALDDLVDHVIAKKWKLAA